LRSLLCSRGSYPKPETRERKYITPFERDISFYFDSETKETHLKDCGGGGGGDDDGGDDGGGVIVNGYERMNRSMEVPNRQFHRVVKLRFLQSLVVLCPIQHQ
jgi:hypothetical protein